MDIHPHPVFTHPPLIPPSFRLLTLRPAPLPAVSASCSQVASFCPCPLVKAAAHSWKMDILVLLQLGSSLRCDRETILVMAELTLRKTDGPSPRPVHCPACNVITSILAGGGSRVHHSCLLGSGLSHVGQVWKHFGQDSCDQGPSSPSFQRLLLRTAGWGKAWREWGSLLLQLELWPACLLLSAARHVLQAAAPMQCLLICRSGSSMIA